MNKYRVEVYYETTVTKEKTVALKFVEPKSTGTIVERADILLDWVGPVLPSDLPGIVEKAVDTLQQLYKKEIIAVHDVKIFPHVPDLSKLLVDYKEKGNGHDKKKADNLRQENQEKGTSTDTM